MTAWSAVARLGSPVDARALFGPELRSLSADLRGLTAADWRRSAAGHWTVHDVVAHVLGDVLGRLGHDTRGGFAAGETIEAFVHRTNQEWVDRHAADRPAALIDALTTAGAELAARYATADLDEPALGVSWAGVDPAPAWLDIAREFTEYWTHRQQIRHAVGHATDPDPRALALVLDTFARALPHTLRDTPAPPGTQLHLVAATTRTATATTTWTATATPSGWSLAEPPHGHPAAIVRLPPDTLWRLATRTIHPTTALANAEVHGDPHLAERACRLLAVVY